MSTTGAGPEPVSPTSTTSLTSRAERTTSNALDVPPSGIDAGGRRREPEVAAGEVDDPGSTSMFPEVVGPPWMQQWSIG
jgi:hypothetical protein